MEEPITGTTEFTAKRIERSPSISAFADTAVLRDRTETKTPHIKDIQVVIARFNVDTSFDKCNSYLNEEHTPSAIKQLIHGIKTFDDKNDRP